MSCIDSCAHTVLVPNDPDRPVIGPFTLACGSSLEWHKEFAAKLGYKDDEYEFRLFISPDEASA